VRKGCGYKPHVEDEKETTCSKAQALSAALDRTIHRCNGNPTTDPAFIFGVSGFFKGFIGRFENNRELKPQIQVPRSNSHKSSRQWANLVVCVRWDSPKDAVEPY